MAVVAVGVVGVAFLSDASAEREASLWTVAPRHKPAATQAAFADLAERARAAVVHVRGEVTEGNAAEADAESSRTSIGTGFIISRDGYVITNEHVVRNVADLRVRLYDGRELPGCVAGADPPDRHRAGQDRVEERRCPCCRWAIRTRFASASR